MGAILQSLGRTVLAGIVLLVIIIILVGALTGRFITVDMTWSTFFMRWLHVLSGVMWIGLLWYFNFVQIPSMPKIPDEQKPAIGKVIAPTALFWFRWAALATVVTGLLLAGMNGYLVLGADPSPRHTRDRHRHVARVDHGLQRLVHHLAESEEGARHRASGGRREGQSGTVGDADLAHQHACCRSRCSIAWSPSRTAGSEPGRAATQEKRGRAGPSLFLATSSRRPRFRRSLRRVLGRVARTTPSTSRARNGPARSSSGCRPIAAAFRRR